MESALLTEHFRYTPLVCCSGNVKGDHATNNSLQTLLDDIINTVNELVFRAINAIEEGLNNTTPESLGFRPDSTDGTKDEEGRRDALHDQKQNEIDNGIVQLESLLNATVDKDFDKFEIYTLRNILAVGHDEEDLAPWVQLEHYKNIELSRTESAPTPEQVQLRRRKLQETAKLNAMLRAEEARNAAVLSQLQALLETDSRADQASSSPFAFLTASPYTAKSSMDQTLHQNVQFALRQLPTLRQLLAQLKDSLQTLPNARHRADEHDSADAKRREYIASQSRRALERRGIEPEDPASASAAAGRKVGRDEVEGMEAVVQALGGAAAVRRTDDEMEE